MRASGDNEKLHGWASWIAYAALLTVAIWLLAETFAPLWQPLLIAAVLAGTTHGWHLALARRLGERPRVAASVMTVALVLLVLVPFALLGTVLVQQSLDAIEYVRAALREGGIEELGSRLPDRIEEPLRRAVERLPINDEALSRQAAAGGWTVARLARDVVEGASKALFGLVMLLIAYYALLLDGRRLVAWVQRALPLPVYRTEEVFVEFRRVSRSVIGSTLLSAAAQAIVAGIGYAIAGVPNVLLFSAITGLVALIPIVGTPLVSLPLAGLLLATGDVWQAIFLTAYSLIVVSTVDNIVKPIVVRGGMQLNGALVFFSLLGGLLAFGAIGLVVGPLAVTFFLAMVRLREVAGTDVAPVATGDPREGPGQGET